MIEELRKILSVDPGDPNVALYLDRLQAPGPEPPVLFAQVKPTMDPLATAKAECEMLRVAWRERLTMIGDRTKIDAIRARAYLGAVRRLEGRVAAKAPHGYELIAPPCVVRLAGTWAPNGGGIINEAVCLYWVPAEDEGTDRRNG